MSGPHGLETGTLKINLTKAIGPFTADLSTSNLPCLHIDGQDAFGERSTSNLPRTHLECARVGGERCKSNLSCLHVEKTGRVRGTL